MEAKKSFHGQSIDQKVTFSLVKSKLYVVLRDIQQVSAGSGDFQETNHEIVDVDTAEYQYFDLSKVLCVETDDRPLQLRNKDKKTNCTITIDGKRVWGYYSPEVIAQFMNSLAIPLD